MDYSHLSPQVQTLWHHIVSKFRAPFIGSDNAVVTLLCMGFSVNETDLYIVRYVNFSIDCKRRSLVSLLQKIIDLYEQLVLTPSRWLTRRFRIRMSSIFFSINCLKKHFVKILLQKFINNCENLLKFIENFFYIYLKKKLFTAINLLAEKFKKIQKLCSIII